MLPATGEQMRLPFADEIQEARQEAEAAGRAAADLARIEGAHLSVGVFLGQLRFRPDLELDTLPGEALVQALAESWSVLADLGSSTPRAAEPTSTRLQARSQQLEIARQTLRPLAAEADSRARHLHDLGHRQRHALEEPRWAVAAAELTRIAAERDALLAALRPIEQQVACLRPVQGVVRPFLLRLRAELTARERPDPRGFAAWHTISLARAVLESLQVVLTPVNLEIPVPPLPARPPEPDPDPEICAGLWWDVEGICDRLGELDDTLTRESERLESERVRLSQQVDELNRGILERTG